MGLIWMIIVECFILSLLIWVRLYVLGCWCVLFVLLGFLCGFFCVFYIVCCFSFFVLFFVVICLFVM